jgi:hypothetical protein
VGLQAIFYHRLLLALSPYGLFLLILSNSRLQLIVLAFCSHC